VREYPSAMISGTSDELTKIGNAEQRRRDGTIDRS
jgi:hypothetical protein